MSRCVLGHHVVDRWTFCQMGHHHPEGESALGFQIGVDACQACRIVPNRWHAGIEQQVIPAAAACGSKSVRSRARRSLVMGSGVDHGQHRGHFNTNPVGSPEASRV